MKIYRGSAAGARAYLEAERGRADDYYLAEGTGYAERYSATSEGVVEARGQLAGDGYEAWVGGVDPDTGELRGRVRNDEHAVRFAEVVVNGPKSWSLAAELHPEIAQAYEAAQDRAAVEIVRWFGQHATTRVGPRGGQVATPVERIEAVSVRHYTSRAGDPHRHLHLQINARVEAAGKWRGIDTVAVRDSIAAVQGIGHATIAADPQFRAALAEHGYTLDPATGELTELAAYVGPFSKRAAQIERQIDGYEAEWRAEHPGQEPGPSLRRSWDARAWAEHRPGKVHVETADQARARWVQELHDLGFTPPAGPVPIGQQAVGQLDRDAAADQVLTRLTAARSAWNGADLRGAAEQVIVEAGIVAESSTRTELAEDITARAQARCVPLLDRDVPEHVRAWTSPQAVAVEDDITGRLALRGAAGDRDRDPMAITAAAAAAGRQLDPAQADAAAALAGDHALIVVTGAAGAGKTTVLATARTVLEDDEHQVLVVTPTLKAARAARRETGAQAGSVGWLLYQHGWRWNDDGAWTRLTPGQVDPDPEAHGRVYRGPAADARMRPGDLVVVDEAGMLDQDAARALLHVLDEHDARLALVGDPHQLPAVGRGGTLDLARRWTERASALDVIHRFTREQEIEPGITATVRDDDYADLSLRMRAGDDPGAVFDQLVDRGQVRTYPDATALRDTVATEAAQARAAGWHITLAADTNAQAHELAAAVRDRLVAGGHVDDTTTAVTASGDRIGAGDLIVTRRNDHSSDVANRDSWTVTTVHPDGSLRVSGQDGDRTLPAGYVAEHVELGYASTVHGVQGETAEAGHLILTEHTRAQSAYVGMTRGRSANTVHVVAEDLADAREQWIATAGRDRVDLGVADARQAAERAASQYAGVADRADPERQLAAVLEQLRDAWRDQALAEQQLAQLEPQLATAQAVYDRTQADDQQLAPLRAAAERTHEIAEQTAGPAHAGRGLLTQRRQQIEAELTDNWNHDRPIAADAAQLIQAGPGRFGRLTGGQAAVDDARRLLDDWATKWRPVLDQLRDTDTAATYAARPAGLDDFPTQLRTYAERVAAAELPQVAHNVQRGERAAQAAADAQNAYQQALDQQRQRGALHGAMTGWRGPRFVDAEDLAELTDQVTALRTQRDQATSTVEQLAHSPAVRAQPDPTAWLATARGAWLEAREHAQRAVATRAAAAADEAARERMARHQHDQPYRPPQDRGGPSIGR